jgi:phosphoglucomutase
MAASFVRVVSTTPIKGQVMGTSGLRKKVTEVSTPNYLENFVQSIFNCLSADVISGKLVLGGDGRYYNKEAIQLIMRIAAANGVRHVIVGQEGFLSTPAASCAIRTHKASGGFLLTASHNPGGPTHDFGLKFNTANGGPSLKELTDAIYAETLKITSYKITDALPTPVDLSALGTRSYPLGTGASFEVEVIDPVVDYLAMLRSAFDLAGIAEFIRRSGFRCVLDSLHAVTGVYTKRIFCDVLGLPESSLFNNVPKPDFGGGHPDPNLVYAKGLVEKMYSGDYDFGAAFDGDGDRNMILGKKFFVTPSDSLAVLMANHQLIPYFRVNGFRGVARSMPTSAAVDKVVQAMEAAGKKVKFFETPTGWKFFGNLMDAGDLSLCGEESFGTGCDLIREKDGIWAAMAWLSILAEINKPRSAAPFLGVSDVVMGHWKQYGRNYYSRYDYEEVDSDQAKAMMSHLADLQKTGALKDAKCGGYGIAVADDFEYRDPVDKSVTSGQGIRFVFADGTRIIFRLSGTGSVGATVRVYFDKFLPPSADLGLDVQVALAELVQLALTWSDIKKFTGRNHPTVIT